MTRERTCPRCGAPLAESIDRALEEAQARLARPGPSPAPEALVSPAVTVVGVEPTPARIPRLRRSEIRLAASWFFIGAALAVGFVLRPSGAPHQTDDRLATRSIPPTTARAPSAAGPDNDEAPEPASLAHRFIPTPPPPPTPTPEGLDPSTTPGLVPVAPAEEPPPASPTPPPQEIVPTPPPPGEPAPAEADGPRRVLVRDEAGRPMVTRVYGEMDDKLVVLLPDGQLGWVDGRSFTDRPFKPATADEVCRALKEGPYRGFNVRKTKHYLVFYRCSESFAADSANLLESLYQGLLGKLIDCGIDVHETEFPLVAVIFSDERAFRAAHRVAPEVQALYQILSNRIFFYEASDRDQTSPEVSAIRKPQTIAHEGTHQILQNIGVHPRLVKWPIWLVEGLAEYWAPTVTKKGAIWAGGGRVNALHMATISDLKDQGSLQRRGPNMPPFRINRDAQVIQVERLVTQTELTPTDYALAWALTHYLATRRVDDFLAYLKAMGRMSLRDRPGPADHLAAFREAFGDDLAKVDRDVDKHLERQKYAPLPYYAVVFEQPTGDGHVRKAALVSQSPSMIRQWLETVQAPGGGPSNWRAFSYPTRTRALYSADQWIGGH